MSLSLARCVEAVARLLDGCGSLEPVRLCLSAGDVQAEVCASGPAASLSMARLAAVSGAEAACGMDDCHDGVITADLEEDVVLVAAVDAPVGRGARGLRTTSTAAAAGLLRTLGPWTAALDRALLPGAQLWVEDHGQGFTIRLLATASSGGDLESVAMAVGTGLAHVRTWHTDSGRDGRGSLPCGRRVHLSIVSLS